MIPLTLARCRLVMYAVVTIYRQRVGVGGDVEVLLRNPPKIAREEVAPWWKRIEHWQIGSSLRPLLWALVVGAWIPILEIPAAQSSAPLAALVFAGVGAAVGYLVARGLKSG